MAVLPQMQSARKANVGSMVFNKQALMNQTFSSSNQQSFHRKIGMTPSDAMLNITVPNGAF